MKWMICIILTIYACAHVIAQNEFEISQAILTDSARAKIEMLKKRHLSFFEDENYLVSKTCSGEWGGSIRFKSKKTGIEYSSTATCPVSVNKINEKYYVTASLAHLSGSCEILEISRPDSMEVFQMPPPRKKKGKKIYRYIGDDESNSVRGTKVIINAFEILALGSFIKDGQLFHVVANNTETFIATIQGGKFEKVESITKEDTFTYENEIIKTESNHLLIPIARGYLDIFENRVVIFK